MATCSAARATLIFTFTLSTRDTKKGGTEPRDSDKRPK